MRQISFRPEIEDDVDDARVWYEKHQFGLGDEFCGQVDRAFDRIRRMGTIFAIVYDDIRVHQIDRFPYAVYFRVRPKRVEIIAVMHTSRDPDAWRSRLDEP